MYSIGCMVSEQLGNHHHGELSTLGMQVGMTNTEGRIVILHLRMYVCMCLEPQLSYGNCHT